MKFDAENTPNVKEGIRKSRKNRFIIVGVALILTILLLLFAYYEKINEPKLEPLIYNEHLYENVNISEINEIESLRRLLPKNLNKIYSDFILDYYDIDNIKTEGLKYANASLESEYFLDLNVSYQDVGSIIEEIDTSIEDIKKVVISDAVAESYRTDLLTYLFNTQYNLKSTSELLTDNLKINVEDLLKNDEVIDNWEHNYSGYLYLTKQIDLSSQKGLLKYYSKEDLIKESKNFITVLNTVDMKSNKEEYIDAKSRIDRFITNLLLYKDTIELSETEIALIEKVELLTTVIEEYYRFLNSVEESNTVTNNNPSIEEIQLVDEEINKLLEQIN